MKEMKSHIFYRKCTDFVIETELSLVLNLVPKKMVGAE
jgi:hypothetical protein